MTTVMDLSEALAGAVERAARSVFAVHGRRRLPSTGVQWHAGLVVTANHTVEPDRRHGRPHEQRCSRSPGDGAARASMGALPLSLVPTFAVPLWTISHVISLLQPRRAGRRPAGARR